MHGGRYDDGCIPHTQSVFAVKYFGQTDFYRRNKNNLSRETEIQIFNILTLTIVRVLISKVAQDTTHLKSVLISNKKKVQNTNYWNYSFY